MVRVGVVGLGFGRAVHLPGWRLVDGVEVVGARGRDWRGLLDEVDVVSVATPPATHAEVALAALAAGKGVLCEKPLAATVAEAEELAAAAGDRATAVNFSYRALPGFRRFRELADGDLTVTWTVGSRLSPGPPSWKDEALAGGGALAAYGVHALDYAVWMLGPAEVVSARIEGPENAFDAELAHESGRRTYLRVSMVSSQRLHRLEAGGHVLENRDLDDPVGAFALDGAPTPALAVPAGDDPRVGPFAVHAAGLVGRDAATPTFADGLAAQRLLEAVRRLAR